MKSSSRRRAHQEEPESHERWLVSYADFITLLFAFFTVLYATSQQDAEKTREFEESIRKHLSGLGGGGPNSGVGGTGSPRPVEVEAATDRLPDPRGSLLAVEAAVAEYQQKHLTAAQREDQVATPEPHGVRVQVKSFPIYAAGVVNLSPEQKAALRPLVVIAAQTGRQVWVEGSAAPQEQRAGLGAWDIASLRASQAVQWLVSQGASPSSLIPSARLQSPGTPGRVDVIVGLEELAK